MHARFVEHVVLARQVLVTRAVTRSVTAFARTTYQMRTGFCASIFAFGIAFATATARAESGDAGEAVDDLDLVKLLNVEVSTATKTAESLDDAPAVITVVSH